MVHSNTTQLSVNGVFYFSLIHEARVLANVRGTQVGNKEQCKLLYKQDAECKPPPTFPLGKVRALLLLVPQATFKLRRQNQTNKTLVIHICLTSF